MTSMVCLVDENDTDLAVKLVYNVSQTQYW